MYTFEQCLPFSRRFYDDVYSCCSSREMRTIGGKNNLVRRETLVITFLRFSQFPSWERWDIYFFLLTCNCISFYLFFFRNGVQRDQGANGISISLLVIFYAIIQMHAWPGVLFRNFNFETNFKEYLNILYSILKYSLYSILE